MRKILILSFLFMCACFSHTSLMTSETFATIELGTPIAEVKETAGEPYAVHRLEGGAEEYEYIERMDLGHELVTENHYYLKVLNGQVVSKRVTREKQPAYDLIYQEDPNYPTYP